MLDVNDFMEIKGYTLMVNGLAEVAYPANLAVPLTALPGHSGDGAKIALDSCVIAAGFKMWPLNGGWLQPLPYQDVKRRLRAGDVVYVGNMPACKRAGIVTLEVMPVVAPKKFERKVYHPD